MGKDFNIDKSNTKIEKLKDEFYDLLNSDSVFGDLYDNTEESFREWLEDYEILKRKGERL